VDKDEDKGSTRAGVPSNRGRHSGDQVDDFIQLLQDFSRLRGLQCLSILKMIDELAPTTGGFDSA
jgi:hypothetical protein